MPVSRISMRIRNDFVLPGDGMWFHEYRKTSGITSTVRAMSGSDMPSTPSVYPAPMTSIHGSSTTHWS